MVLSHPLLPQTFVIFIVAVAPDGNEAKEVNTSLTAVGERCVSRYEIELPTLYAGATRMLCGKNPTVVDRFGKLIP